MGLKEKTITLLYKAYKKALTMPSVKCKQSLFIDTIIDNNHLTFKYILFTAILAKAADESINTLCLQKGSKLKGAYDARSICHKVIVPFEIEVLNKVLGGSNEPFLNKPARYPELSKKNPVRSGNNQKLLNCLCDNLPKIDTSEKAYNCLVYLLNKLILLKRQQERMLSFKIPKEANLPISLYLYITKALEHSYEGEVLTLTVAGIYHLMYLSSSNSVVEVHPVNQCGASSHEVSDLDIYLDGKLISSNELKDKSFTPTDVKHAADKVIKAGGNRMLFIKGPRSNNYNPFEEEIANEYANKNFFLYIIPCDEFFASTISSLETIDCQEFMDFILKTAHETKFKEETIQYMYDLAQNILGLYKNK